jgi:uncharacterized membrane protein
MSRGRIVLAAIGIAVATHLAFIYAVPRVLMNVAIERIGAGGFNAWRVADRVTPQSRQVVRPAPDFAYSACAFDLSDGPVLSSAAPWDGSWSLSLYAANSDNFFVIDDREARLGTEITLVRRGRSPPDGAAMAVESPSVRGIALIRRLAPTPSLYNAASGVAREDVCSSAGQLVG